MRPGAWGRGSQGQTHLARDPLLWEAGEVALEPRQDQPWGLPGEGGPCFPWLTGVVLGQAAPGWPLCPGGPGWPRRLCAHLEASPAPLLPSGGPRVRGSMRSGPGPCCCSITVHEASHLRPLSPGEAGALTGLPAAVSLPGPALAPRPEPMSTPPHPAVRSCLWVREAQAWELQSSGEGIGPHPPETGHFWTVPGVLGRWRESEKVALWRWPLAGGGVWALTCEN